MIQNGGSDHAWGNVDAELEIDVECDVDDAILERRALVVRLDNDQYIDVGFGRGVASRFGSEETQVGDMPVEIASKPFDELHKSASPLRLDSHGRSIAARTIYNRRPTSG